MDVYPQACVFLLIIITLALAYTAVRFPSEQKRLVVFRLGKFIDVRGPGLVFLIPIIEYAVEVDLLEQEGRISEKIMTRDKAEVDMELIWRYQIFDPAQSVLEVANMDAAAKGMICTTLRKTLREMNRPNLRMNRRHITRQVEAELSAIMRRWGTELKGVEIKEIREL